eukprot:m.89927 g.89927  ORF g.89927 m.89927 type:complete len:371 (-) comp21554_c0_seq3:95-1207(-)
MATKILSIALTGSAVFLLYKLYLLFQTQSLSQLSHPLSPTYISTKPTFSISCPPGFYPENRAFGSTCQPCPAGTYTLASAGVTTCTSILNCGEIRKHVQVGERFAVGGVKQIFRATLFGTPVLYSKGKIKEDFDHGCDMLFGLTPHPHVVQPLGICKDLSVLVTPFYIKGSLYDLHQQRDGLSHDSRPEWELRLQLASDYLAILAYLHSSPLGVRVMCDGDRVSKLMSQFLVSNDYRLLLNDVDALPEVTSAGSGIKCGHRQFHYMDGFTPPEQLWPFTDREFRDEEMPPYDEKIDIWKAFFVVKELVSVNVPMKLQGILFDHLQGMQLECLQPDPRLRPSAQSLFQSWQTLSDILHTTMYIGHQHDLRM